MRSRRPPESLPPSVASTGSASAGQSAGSSPHIPRQASSSAVSRRCLRSSRRPRTSSAGPVTAARFRMASTHADGLQPLCVRESHPNPRRAARWAGPKA
ncbi:hypothetical protein ACFPRL_18700 [Pseudoclavibacter helvolus]